MKIILLEVKVSDITGESLRQQILDDFADVGIEGDIKILEEVDIEETSDGEATESHSQTEET